MALLALNPVFIHELLAAPSGDQENVQSPTLPADLAKHLDHLESLRIDQLTGKNFQWLHSKKLTQLEIWKPVEESLAGIDHAGALNKLTINLIGSPVSSLKELNRLK